MNETGVPVWAHALDSGAADPCMICQDPLEAEGAVVCTNGHRFHRECVGAWCKSTQQQRLHCPTCRVSMVDELRDAELDCRWDEDEEEDGYEDSEDDDEDNPEDYLRLHQQIKNAAMHLYATFNHSEEFGYAAVHVGDVFLLFTNGLTGDPDKYDVRYQTDQQQIVSAGDLETRIRELLAGNFLPCFVALEKVLRFHETSSDSTWERHEDRIQIHLGHGVTVSRVDNSGVDLNIDAHALSIESEDDEFVSRCAEKLYGGHSWGWQAP